MKKTKIEFIDRDFNRFRTNGFAMGSYVKNHPIHLS